MVQFKETSKKVNIFLIIFLVIIVIITILCALNPTFGELLAIGNWFDVDGLAVVPFWTVVGFVMIVCFLGALIPIPVPYPLPITLFAAVWIGTYSYAWGLIIALVLLSAIANSIGDMLDYVIGRGAEHIMSQEDPDLGNRWSQIILKKPKAIPPIIILFGATPLPDSLLMVPLGIVKYDVKKTFVWMFIGKIIQMLFFALMGVFALEAALDAFSSESSSTAWISGALLLYLMWVIVFLMIKISPQKKDEE